jgi:small subunit ribosomal protein S20
MAKRSKSGLKRKRQSVKRALQNQQVRSELKTLAKTAAQSPDQLVRAIAALDAAARKGIIHPNAAARKKSRLVRRVARETAGTRH